MASLKDIKMSRKSVSFSIVFFEFVGFEIFSDLFYVRFCTEFKFVKTKLSSWFNKFYFIIKTQENNVFWIILWSKYLFSL